MTLRYDTGVAYDQPSVSVNVSDAAVHAIFWMISERRTTGCDRTPMTKLV